MDYEQYAAGLGRDARSAAKAVAASPVAQRNAALSAMAVALDDQREGLRAANDQDLAAGAAAGVPPSASIAARAAVSRFLWRGRPEPCLASGCCCWRCCCWRGA